MVIPPAITPEEHARLWREIRSAEAKTSGEIYVVVAHSADDFRLVPFLWAAAVALALPWILWFATGLAFETILVLQVLAFLAVSAALSPAAVRYRIVPRGIAGDAAHRAAVAQLMAHGVHLDSNRTAILIYVCVLPRQIEIVADEVIHAKLAAKHWQELIRLIAAEAQSGRLADGLAAAIRTAGEFLAKEFPATGARHSPDMSRIIET
jgi:putative membrane protein